MFAKGLYNSYFDCVDNDMSSGSRYYDEAAYHYDENSLFDDITGDILIKSELHVFPVVVPLLGGGKDKIFVGEDTDRELDKSKEEEISDNLYNSRLDSPFPVDRCKLRLPRRPILNFLFYRNNNKRMIKERIFCQRHPQNISECGFRFFSSVCSLNIDMCLLDYESEEKMFLELYALIYSRYYILDNQVFEREVPSSSHYNQYYSEYNSMVRGEFVFSPLKDSTGFYEAVIKVNDSKFESLVPFVERAFTLPVRDKGKVLRFCVDLSRMIVDMPGPYVVTSGKVRLNLFNLGLNKLRCFITPFPVDNKKFFKTRDQRNEVQSSCFRKIEFTQSASYDFQYDVGQLYQQFKWGEPDLFQDSVRHGGLYLNFYVFSSDREKVSLEYRFDLGYAGFWLKEDQIYDEILFDDYPIK